MSVSETELDTADFDAQTRNLMDFMSKLNVPSSSKSTRGKSSGRGARGKGNIAKRKRQSPSKGTSGDVDEGGDVLNAILEEMKGIRGDIAEVKVDVAEINGKFDAFEERIMALERENCILKNELKKKDVQLCDMSDRIDGVEQRERHLEIVVSSPDLSSLSEDNFKDSFVALAAGKLQLSRDFLSRFSVRRVGREGRRRALLLAPSHGDRSELFAAARTVRPANFYVSDSLIKSREDLFYEIRKYKRDNNLHFSAYSYRGEIYCKRNQNSNPVKVKSVDEVKSMFSSGS